MIYAVSQAIDKFYRKKDYETFKRLSSEPLELFPEIKIYLKAHWLTFTEEPNKSYPSREWVVQFNDLPREEFEVSYTTILKVSKVAPFFYVEHRFSVKNQDPNGTVPYLTGFAGMGYVKRSFVLHEEITKVFKSKGYHELNYPEMIEVPDWFIMPEGVTHLGPNVTVEHLLFMDIFQLCSQ